MAAVYRSAVNFNALVVTFLNFLVLTFLNFNLIFRFVLMFIVFLDFVHAVGRRFMTLSDNHCRVCYVLTNRLMRDIVNNKFKENFDDLFRHLAGDQQCLTVVIYNNNL